VKKINSNQKRNFLSSNFKENNDDKTLSDNKGEREDQSVERRIYHSHVVLGCRLKLLIMSRLIKLVITVILLLILSLFLFLIQVIDVVGLAGRRTG
jgi:hypothetical protein